MLTTRFLDFWLLGGASILVWLVMIATEGFRASWAIDQHFKNLTVTTASLSLLAAEVFGERRASQPVLPSAPVRALAS